MVKMVYIIKNVILNFHFCFSHSCHSLVVLIAFDGWLSVSLLLFPVAVSAKYFSNNPA